MSVLITGAEMPKNCGYCFMNEYMTCRWLDEDASSNGRLDGCPLIELPQHGDLIDRDELFPIYADLLDGDDVKPVVPKSIIDTAAVIVPREEST